MLIAHLCALVGAGVLGTSTGVPGWVLQTDAVDEVLQMRWQDG